MRLLLRSHLLVVPALLCVLACKSTPRAQRAEPKVPVLSVEAADALVEELIRVSLERSPGWARWLGFHEYDGKVAPVGMAAVQDQTAFARRYLQKLSKVDVSQLPDPQRLDIELTRLQAEQWLFSLEDRAEHRRLMNYQDQFDLSQYLQRDYAPLATRVDAVINHLDAAVRNVDVMMGMLDPVQPRTHLLTAQSIYEGHLEYLTKDVVEIVTPALEGSAELKTRFQRSHAAALKEVQRILTWIGQSLPRASEDYRLGEKGLLRMLQVNEGLTTDLPLLRAMAAQDFERNRTLFEETARQLAPDRTPEQVALMIANEHVPAADVLRVAGTQLTELRTFIQTREVISIPGEEECTVAVTPPFMRYNSAFLDAAGPFEHARVSFYFITPPDPSWPAAKQEGYLPNTGTLMATSIHEVYPGHFVQGLHMRNARSRAQKMFASYAFSEGWAHYTEQMMLDAGFAEGNARMRLGQLADALLRNCRFLATLGLHVDGMSVEAAQKLFQEKCFVDEGNAQQQAFRGTYDPCLLYTSPSPRD